MRLLCAKRYCFNQAGKETCTYCCQVVHDGVTVEFREFYTYDEVLSYAKGIGVEVNNG